MAEENSKHTNHRQRMYDRYKNSGIEAFAEHEVLEMLLYYTITRKDVNPLAHDLIKRYGSFARVLDAHPDDLMKSEGISSRCAVFLNMLPKVMRLYQTQKASSNKVLNSTKFAIEYIENLFLGENKEIFYLLCLDAKCRLIQSIQIDKGEVGEVKVHPRKIVETALRYNSINVIFAHNHPSGKTQPSSDDINFTNRLINTMFTIDIRVLDHIIVNETSAYSFAKEGDISKSISNENMQIASNVQKYKID